MIYASCDAYVVRSEVTIADEGAATLAEAFRGRIRLVESAPGFQRIEVWRDVTAPGRFQMVTWWDNRESFALYMRSSEHHASHDRIPSDPQKPRGTGVYRYERLQGV